MNVADRREMKALLIEKYGVHLSCLVKAVQYLDETGTGDSSNATRITGMISLLMYHG